MKQCKKCGVQKRLSAFHRSADGRDGRKTSCAECENAINRVRGRREKYHLTRWARLKAAVIEAYGGKCVCCGESHPVFLAVNHKADDGAEHRRLLGFPNGGTKFYAWVIRAGFPDSLQLLCHNCNHAKRHGVCPHQLNKPA